MCHIKSSEALVFAGEIKGEFKTGTVPKHKALLPGCGQPIAYFAIRALEQSNVE